MSTVNALVAAARDGDVGQIKTLAKQCDVNTKDELGWCAVHRAAVHGQVASLRCLVANGADLDAVDDDGWRAIHRAAWVGDCPTLKALVELGAGVETACDATGETAVHVAARNGRLKALRCLATELGANVAARDAFGRTARTKRLALEDLAEVAAAARHPAAGVRGIGVTRLAVLTHYFPEARQAYAVLAQHRDLLVREFAVTAAANTATALAATVVRQALDDPEWAVRKAAARVAGAVALPEGRAVLESALATEADARVRVALELGLRFQERARA